MNNQEPNITKEAIEEMSKEDQEELLKFLKEAALALHNMVHKGEYHA